MRIALDARYLTGKGSGIGNYTLNLARAMLRLDPELELLMVHRGGAGQRIEDPRVERVVFPFHPLLPTTRLALGHFMRGRRFDLFHSTCDMSPGGVPRPLVATVHDINWIVNPAYNSDSHLSRLFLGAYYKLNLDATMRDASRILTVSHSSRRAIVEYSPWYEPKLRVTYNGLDPETIQQLDPDQAFAAIRHVVPPGTPFVLTLGHTSPHKNHPNAIRAFLEAFAHRPDYRMILVRRLSERDRKLQQLLQTPEGKQKVIVLPHVSGEVINALYCAARIYFHPSYYEGFGIPLLEAMAAGTPVVTSSISAMPEVAGDAALLASPADVSALAAALQRVDQEQPLRQQLVEAGRKRVRQFTWSSTARATLEVYRELVGSPTGQGTGR